MNPLAPNVELKGQIKSDIDFVREYLANALFNLYLNQKAYTHYSSYSIDSLPSSNITSVLMETLFRRLQEVGKMKTTELFTELKET